MVAAFVVLLGVLAFAPQLQEGDAVPPVPLVDQDGRTFSLEALQGRAVVLAFVYTRCADRCSLVAAKLARLAREGDPRSLAVVALTIDPRHDGPATLYRYRASFGASPRWTIATGPPGSLLLFERRLGVEPAVQAGGRIDHDDVAVLLDARGRIARIIRGSEWTPPQLAAVARAVVGGPPDGVAAVRVWLADAVSRCGQNAVTLGAGAAVMLVCVLTFAIGWPLVAGILRDERR